MKKVFYINDVRLEFDPAVYTDLTTFAAYVNERVKTTPISIQRAYNQLTK